MEIKVTVNEQETRTVTSKTVIGTSSIVPETGVLGVRILKTYSDGTTSEDFREYQLSETERAKLENFIKNKLQNG